MMSGRFRLYHTGVDDTLLLHDLLLPAMCTHADVNESP